MPGLEKSTRPLVFTSASGCRASETLDDFQCKLTFFPYMPIIFVMQGKCLFEDISSPECSSIVKENHSPFYLFYPQHHLSSSFSLFLIFSSLFLLPFAFFLPLSFFASHLYCPEIIFKISIVTKHRKSPAFGTLVHLGYYSDHNQRLPIN